MVKGALSPHNFRHAPIFWCLSNKACHVSWWPAQNNKAVKQHRLIVLSRTRSSSHRTSSQQLSCSANFSRAAHLLPFSYTLCLFFTLLFYIRHSNCELRNKRYQPPNMWIVNWCMYSILFHFPPLRQRSLNRFWQPPLFCPQHMRGCIYSDGKHRSLTSSSFFFEL